MATFQGVRLAAGDSEVVGWWGPTGGHNPPQPTAVVNLLWEAHHAPHVTSQTFGEERSDEVGSSLRVGLVHVQKIVKPL